MTSFDENIFFSSILKIKESRSIAYIACFNLDHYCSHQYDNHSVSKYLCCEMHRANKKYFTDL